MISVVIPLFNKEKQIAKTIQSVLNQTEKPFEIIVVNDGSTDKSFDVVKNNYSDSVILLSQDNSGVSAARNAGVSAAKGEFIAFLDADDYWECDHIKTISFFLKNNPFAVFVSTGHKVFRDGNFFIKKYSNNIVDVSDFFEAFSENIAVVNSSSVVISKEKFVQAGGFPVGVRKGEDLICWFQIGLENKFNFINSITSVYNRDAENRSDEIISTKAPDSLHFLLDISFNKNILKDRRIKVMKCFDRVAFFSAIGAKFSNDYMCFNEILMLSLKAKRYLLYIKILIINKIPIGFLKKIRNFR